MKKTELKTYQSIIEQGLSIRAAARILNLPVSTTHRRLNKFKEFGNLTHQNTGKQNRPSRADKQAILDIIYNKYDIGFSYSHLSELLEEREKFFISKETLRYWLKRPRVYKLKKQRQRRECSPCFGDLLQLDGSFEYWIEGEKHCLMNLIDDATNISMLYFDKQETIEAACHCAWKWFKKYGVPLAFYVDGRIMYHLSPNHDHNFFTAMCQRLGIKVILAHSPQAKGRVERYNGVHQQRLIPLLKLDGVHDTNHMNKYLENYIVKFNKRFSKSPKNGNSHRPLPSWAKNIEDLFYLEIERTIKNDWTFSFKNKIYQIPRQSSYPPAKKKILIKVNIFGNISTNYRCSILNYS